MQVLIDLFMIKIRFEFYKRLIELEEKQSCEYENFDQEFPFFLPYDVHSVRIPTQTTQETQQSGHLVRTQLSLQDAQGEDEEKCSSRGRLSS